MYKSDAQDIEYRSEATAVVDKAAEGNLGFKLCGTTIRKNNVSVNRSFRYSSTTAGHVGQLYDETFVKSDDCLYA